MIELGRETVKKAIQKGAEECDIFITIDEEFAVTVKDGEVESLKQAVTKGLGLRVFKKGKIGFAYTTDFSNFGIERVVDEALEFVEHSTSEFENHLPENYPTSFVNLKIYDSEVLNLGVSERIKIAMEIERSAISFDPRVKVESTGFGNRVRRKIIVSSKGFEGEYESTIFESYCSAIATENSGSQTGFYSSVSRFFRELESPEDVGRKAGWRAVQSLNPRKVKTGRYPVVFDPMTAPALLEHIASAVNGKNVYRKMSFLAEKLGEKISAEILTVIDDGLLDGGIGSKPFDDEGLETRTKKIIENGVLKFYLLDFITAKKFGVEPTGNAHRRFNTLPSPSPLNFYIKPMEKSPNEIISEIKEGLLVTKLIGFGVDIVSGNFSKGASGLWIKDGEISFAVDGITIAGNLAEILKNIDAIGNDLKFYGKIASPTIRVAEMTVAGE